MPTQLFCLWTLVIAYSWETVEHYLEADSWPAVMYWMQGVEFWGNRSIADPSVVLAGALVFRRWGSPALAVGVRVALAAWLIVHIVVFPDSMVLQRLLPSVGSFFGEKTTSWFDIWTLNHFASGISIGALLLSNRTASRPPE